MSRNVAEGDWFLHHDNAPNHTIMSIQKFLAKTKWGCSPPPSSPDLARNFFLYPWMKQDLKRRHFADIAEVQLQSLVALDSISIEDFR